MKFYSGNKLLSYKDLYGHKPEIFLSTGNRSSGKTTFFNKYLINRFKKHNEKFMLVYRWGNELEGVASKFFKDISALKFPNDTMADRKRENGAFLELFLNDKPCGYAVAINKAEKIKKLSHYFNDVSRMLFDEFQSESGEYCPHEVSKLISIHTSVARGHGQPVRYVPLIMISNLTSLINPYYMALGIADRLTPSTNILRGDGWVLEQSKMQGISNAQKESAFNRAFSGSDYVKYSTDNVYLNDNLSFIDNLDSRINMITKAINDVNEGKPNPEAIYRTLSEFGFNCEEAIMVGDTMFDIRMGINAGCRTCGVTYGTGSPESLSEATWVIDDFKKLLTLV